MTLLESIEEEDALGIFVRTVLGTILGGKLGNIVWSRRMSQEFKNIYKEADMNKYVKCGILQWAAQLVRMSEGKKMKIIFSREPCRGRRLQGMPCIRWLYAMEDFLATLTISAIKAQGGMSLKRITNNLRNF